MLQYIRRTLLIVSSIAYAAVLFFSYKEYLHPVWGYFGFSFNQPTGLEIALVLVALTATSALLPTSLHRPSSVILLFLYSIVYIPSVVVTLCLSEESMKNHWEILLALTITIAFCSIISRLGIGAAQPDQGDPPRKLIHIFVAFWIFCVLINVGSYYSIMGFATVETTYEQREAGASKNAMTAYTQTLLSSVFSPVLFSIGLIYRKQLLLLMGVVGSVIIYSITAQKTILLLPVITYLFFKLQNYKSPIINNTSTPLILLSIISLVSILFYESSIVASLAAALLVFRTIAIPGLTYSQYADFFSQNGYTWWSHIKGFSSLIDAPSLLSQNSLWPSLGYLIGEHEYGRSDLNANANLFSGDGVAAAGWVGVLLIGLILSIWLVILDRVAAKWDSRYSTLAVLPFAISLTNGHFFTSLLSFGGLAWLIVFYLFRPEKHSSTDRQKNAQLDRVFHQDALG